MEKLDGIGKIIKYSSFYSTRNISQDEEDLHIINQTMKSHVQQFGQYGIRILMNEMS